MTREEQIRNKAKELGQKYFPDEANVWARGNIEAEYVENACVEMAEWLDQHPHWISVEERLPEHCDCLLYTEPRNIHGPFEGRFRFGFYNYADQRWEIRGEKWDNTIVTHWMPIEPPRKEE